MPPASDPRAPFPVRRIHEVEPRSGEQRWLVDQLFARSSVGLLGGPAKAFKTWVAAELALAVATGAPAFGRFAAPDPGPVVFFGAEDPPPDLRLRFEGIARARSLDLAKAPLLLLDVAQLRLDDQVHLRRLHRNIAYFTHHERRNRRMVNTETVDGERPAMETVIGWTYFVAGSFGSRRDGPFSTSLWAPWMRRSQIASAWVGSLM